MDPASKNISSDPANAKNISSDPANAKNINMTPRAVDHDIQTDLMTWTSFIARCRTASRLSGATAIKSPP